MKRHDDLPSGCILPIFILLAAIGWIMNLVAFCQCDFEAPYKEEAIRGVGIFLPPVGWFAGYIDIEDGNESSP